MPTTRSGRALKRRLHAHAERRLANLARIGRAHRGHPVGIFYAGFQWVDDAVREVVGVEQRLGRSSPRSAAAALGMIP